jgi:hypothetical protein
VFDAIFQARPYFVLTASVRFNLNVSLKEQVHWLLSLRGTIGLLSQAHSDSCQRPVHVLALIIICQRVPNEILASLVTWHWHSIQVETIYDASVQYSCYVIH